MDINACAYIFVAEYFRISAIAQGRAAALGASCLSAASVLYVPVLVSCNANLHPATDL